MKLLRRKFLVRTLSFFFMLEIVSSTLLPTLSWALTSGPTAPEATSFEPVDTTDIVNLSSGDLSYSIPFIEVPGPSGNYPLSLSYHAGIQTNEDASWAGLGWSLNPGAINRNVNGFADDMKNISQVSRTFWEGGVSKSFSVSVNVSSAGNPSVTAGLSHSEDTYAGFNQTSFLSVGNLSVERSHSDYGNGLTKTSTNVSTTVGKGAVGVKVSMGSGAGFSSEMVSNVTNPEDKINSAKGQISAMRNMDVSLATAKSYLLSRVGISVTSKNSKEGSVSVSSKGFNASVPTPWGIRLDFGRSTRRYWIDETETTQINGALNFPQSTDPLDLDNKAFDVYDLQNFNGLDVNKSPDESFSGSFVDFDNYVVLAQGISGSMRPYSYRAELVRRNKKHGQGNNYYRMKSYRLNSDSYPTNFRFIGDFSNRFKYNVSDTEFSWDNDSQNPLGFSFNGQPQTGESGSDGYEVNKNLLYGSKHVEWFTNHQILFKEEENSAFGNGFLDTETTTPLSRPDNEKIGGFKITNENGVTYHYALPVYSYDEESYSGRVDVAGKHSFNHFKNHEPYAVSWLLTAVTGPDYVDKNLNGFADQGDFGYWVCLQYGLWSSNYGWRNPGIGFNKDIDQSFDNFSMGKKRQYYLDAIKTQSHTALFVKSPRYDGKGSVPAFNDESAIRSNSSLTFDDVDKGSFESKPPSPRDGITKPGTTLKLQSVYLIQNSDFNSYEDLVSSIAVQSNDYDNGNPRPPRERVLDSLDLEIEPFKTLIKAKAIKIIKMNYDYSLCPGTANSYKDSDVAPYYGHTPSLDRLGKLTLKSINILGKGEASLIPPIKFNYDLPENYLLTAIQNNRVASGGQFSAIKGDIIKVKSQATTGYYLVSDQQGANHTLKFLGGDPLAEDGSWVEVQYTKTKNPNYNRDFYDIWGMYKSDYENLGSENVSRMTTSTSAQNVDAWSLREISTAIGTKIKVQYQSDKYTSSLKSLSNVPIKDIVKISPTSSRITLYESVEEYGLTEGNNIMFTYAIRVKYKLILGDIFFCGGAGLPTIYKWFPGETVTAVPIQSIDGNSFTVDFVINDFSNTSGKLIKATEDYDIQDYRSELAQNGYKRYTHEGTEFIGGDLIFSNSTFSPYGGGIAVKSITTETMDVTRSTLYEYSQGTTSYEPTGYSMPLERTPETLVSCLKAQEDELFNDYRTNIFLRYTYKNYIDLFANARELPGPGVMYGKVKVYDEIKVAGSDDIIESDSYNEYHFETFSPRNVSFGSAPSGISANVITAYNSSLRNTVTIPGGSSIDKTISGVKVVSVSTSDVAVVNDFTALYGNLKKSINYGADGTKISEVSNNYLHDNGNLTTYRQKLAPFNDQGLITETFVDSRIVLIGESIPTQNSTYGLFGIVSQKVFYPSIQTSQITTNYKSGITTEDKTIAYDFYSGQATKTLSTDGYGSHFVNEVVPAYRIEAYKSGMGLAALGGKNMLTQEAYSITRKVVPTDPLLPIDNTNYTPVGIVSASAQTWSNQIPALYNSETETTQNPQPGVWRKHASYSFIGNDAIPLGSDGLLAASEFSDFTAWTYGSVTPEKWQKNAEITLYDVASHALEAMDMNDDYAATKTDSKHERVLATVANARYTEFAYSGSEDEETNGHFGGHVLKVGALSTDKAHTGTKSIVANSGQGAFKYNAVVSSAKKLYASVWSDRNDGKIMYKINGGAASVATLMPVKQAGDWYQLNAMLPDVAENASVEIWCEASSALTYFDDFRVHPYDAAMISYVYNEWGELSHILDNNNMFTEYLYDAMGRLEETKRETFSKGVVRTSKTEYYYKEPVTGGNQ